MSADVNLNPGTSFLSRIYGNGRLLAEENSRSFLCQKAVGTRVILPRFATSGCTGCVSLLPFGFRFSQGWPGAGVAPCSRPPPLSCCLSAKTRDSVFIQPGHSPLLDRKGCFAKIIEVTAGVIERRLCAFAQREPVHGLPIDGRGRGL